MYESLAESFHAKIYLVSSWYLQSMGESHLTVPDIKMHDWKEDSEYCLSPMKLILNFKKKNVYKDN